MTEAEWRTCGSRVHMRHQLRSRRHSPLRWVKFNLACIQRIHELIDDDRCLRMIRSLEQCASVSALRARGSQLNGEQAEVREAVRDLWRRHDDPLRAARIAAARAVQTAMDATLATSQMVALATGRWRWREREERRAHCALIREIFGTPFRAVVFSRDWCTNTATSLARHMDASRDFSTMPILADALQDAGCDSADILNHCRDASATHVPGCWVAGLVLDQDRR